MYTCYDTHPTCYYFLISHIHEVPSEVNHVVINVTSDSSILVQWDPPTYPNGILTFYDVIVFNILTNFNFSAQIDVLDTREVIVTEMGK